MFFNSDRSNRVQIKAKIVYSVTESHPDIKYIEKPKEELEFEDKYFVDKEIEREVALMGIRNDLMLVAGGGYDSEHVINPKFYFDGQRVY